MVVSLLIFCLFHHCPKFKCIYDKCTHMHEIMNVLYARVLFPTALRYFSWIARCGPRKVEFRICKKMSLLFCILVHPCETIPFAIQFYFVSFVHMEMGYVCRSYVSILFSIYSFHEFNSTDNSQLIDDYKSRWLLYDDCFIWDTTFLLWMNAIQVRKMKWNHIHQVFVCFCEEKWNVMNNIIELSFVYLFAAKESA